MKNKKLLLTYILFAIIIIILLLTGNKRNDIYLKKYEVIDNGNKISLNVGVTSSSGYIRKMKLKSKDNKYYLSFYSTFGINSKLGSKDNFIIEIDKNINEIYIYTESEYKKVLEKNNDIWQEVE